MSSMPPNSVDEILLVDAHILRSCQEGARIGVHGKQLLAVENILGMIECRSASSGFVYTFKRTLLKFLSYNSRAQFIDSGVLLNALQCQVILDQSFCPHSQLIYFDRPTGFSFGTDELRRLICTDGRLSVYLFYQKFVRWSGYDAAWMIGFTSYNFNPDTVCAGAANGMICIEKSVVPPTQGGYTH
ncbi:hypothetical protein GMORB2_3694 [Geosmithia morbida]|uniref:Uncharacterized protein n=1 Tax=Geosmithia morbida TaxID=1094350 RepID=A0A9P4YZD6_9HYPO|nr:uncharacterized protein GMORB2_3694 [Geosmithia morbida]KAF4124855.1 hypothetical protein GMORB2_3694 [Geosmithia morbida]